MEGSMGNQYFNYLSLKSRTHYLRVLLPYLTPTRIHNLAVSSFSYLLGRKHSGIAPSILTILLTFRCNYSCIMCQINSNKENLYDYHLDIDFDIIEKLLKENAKYLTLVRISGGEPTHYKEFSRLIDLLGKLNIPYCLATNGSLLISELCRKLLKGCLWISISLDAADTNIYKRMRRNGSMETIMANLEVLNKIKDEHCSKTPLINASMATFTFNLKEMPALVHFCHQYGISGLTVMEGNSYDTPLVREEHLVKYHVTELNKMIQESKRLAKELGVIIRYTFPCLNGRKTEKTKVNLDLYLSARLHPDLNVYMNPSVNTILGNLNRNSLQEVWNGDNLGFTTFREGKKSYNYTKFIKEVY